MKIRKTFFRLLGILAAFFCLQTGVKAADNSSLSLEHVTFYKGITQEEGYYQLDADREEGSIRLLNQGYRQLTVTGHTHFASFSSMVGDSPIRGFSPFGASKEYTPLRFDVKKHLLIARDGTEGFCVYPGSGAAYGTGYSLSSLNEIEDTIFSSLPTYGICLQYSADKEGVRFQMLPLLPNQFKAEVHYLDSSGPIYEETYTANIPAEAIWLRISLSCAKQLQGPDGQILANGNEQPAKISSIRCDEKAILPQESSPPSIPSTPSGSTSSPDSSTPGDPPSTPPETPESSGSSGEVASSSAPESSSSDVTSSAPNPEKPAENWISASPSGNTSRDEEILDSPPVRPSRGRLTKEPVHYSAAAPTKSLPEAPAALGEPSSESRPAQDSTSSQSAESLEAVAPSETNPDEASTEEKIGKRQDEEITVALNNPNSTAPEALQPAVVQTMPSPEKPAPTEHSSFSSATLLLYLALVGGAAAFFLGMRIGIQKGRRGGEASQKVK